MADRRDARESQHEHDDAPHEQSRVSDRAMRAALVAEATKKAGLIWVTLAGTDRAHPVWHVWHGGAAYVITGGAEQPLPGISDAKRATVTTPSKDKGGRLISWLADVSLVTPETEQWQRVIPELHAKRLNAADGEDQPRRWARESTLVHLEPTGSASEAPGDMPDDAHAASPPPTRATTNPPLPYVLGRRKRKGRD